MALRQDRDWVCENVFCNMRDVCSNWTNCLGCKDRARFMTFVLSDRTPGQTAWGRKILKVKESKA